MIPTSDGPEHLPLPSSARAGPRKSGAVDRAAAAIPVPQSVVALLAVALAGVGVWFAGARTGAVPAPTSPEAAITPAIESPTKAMHAAASVPLEFSTPAAAPARVAPTPVAARAVDRTTVVAGPSVAPALPEPPTAEEKFFVPNAQEVLDPQPQTLAPAKVARLFNRRIGSFVPFKDAPRFQILSLTQTPQPAGTSSPSNLLCPDCDGAAANSGYTDRRPTADRIIGTMVYVGPCKDGHIYRITNNMMDVIPATTYVAPDGEVWSLGPLSPSQNVEIRSRVPIRELVVENYITDSKFTAF